MRASILLVAILAFATINYVSARRYVEQNPLPTENQEANMRAFFKGLHYLKENDISKLRDIARVMDDREPSDKELRVFIAHVPTPDIVNAVVNVYFSGWLKRYPNTSSDEIDSYISKLKAAMKDALPSNVYRELFGSLGAFGMLW